MTREGEGFIRRCQDRFAMALTPKGGGAAIDLAITSRNGKSRYGATLHPGC